MRLPRLLDVLGPAVTSIRRPLRPRAPAKLVALPSASTPAADLLRDAAREYVEASNAYATAWETRFNGRRQKWMKHGFCLSFVVPLKLARDRYYERAITSSDPFHQDIALLIEDARRSFFGGADRPAVHILQNWLRDEPRMETRSGESWFAVTAPRFELARARWTGDFMATLSLEAKRKLPPSTVVHVDVGAEVSSAIASVHASRKDTNAKADVIWRESRIWVMLGDRPLDEGDLVNITVSSAKPVSRPETVRIAKTGVDARHSELVLAVNF